MIRFFRESISSFRSEEEDLSHVLTDILSESFVTVTKLGEASYDSGDELMVFTCQVKGTLSTRSAKKRQYDLAKRILKDDFKDGAIFVFYDDEGRFRFSFIRRNYGAATAQDRYTPLILFLLFLNFKDATDIDGAMINK